MSFLTTAAQGASIANSIAATNYAASAASAVGQTQAGAERYNAAVSANQYLVASENAARSAETNAANESFNASVADNLAKAATEEAGAGANDYRRTLLAKLASSRAAGAASGLVLEGSPLMVDRNIFSQIEFGAQRKVYAGTVASNAYRNQGLLLRQQAERDLQTADLARAAGRQSATNALGAGDLAAGAAEQAGSVRAGSAVFAGTANTINGFSNLGGTFYRNSILGRPAVGWG